MHLTLHKYKISLLHLVVLLGVFQFQSNVHGQSIHSHNDYEQAVPFWDAFSGGLQSFEVDVFLKNGELYATHEESEIIEDRNIENLYLQPIQKALALKLGEQKAIQVLIDIKSEAEPTLQRLVAMLEQYPDIIGDNNITLVISGNRPPIDTYINYPQYIKFDYQSLENIDNEKVWDKVALISLNFKKISPWNGLGRLTSDDLNKVKATIHKAHSYGKPFRFWATPDTKTAWRALADLGVDFINTDMPFVCMDFVNSLEKRRYGNKVFSEVYTPHYTVDQKEKPVKNIILLIGDGNGLSQISSAALANGGALTLTQLKSIGFLKTASADDFTTDSAAAGTALATGNKTYNRAIGLDTLRMPLANIPEVLADSGFVSGCITTDKLTGATPASFYSHQEDRSQVTSIAADLSKSKLSLFVGGGKTDFENSENLVGFTLVDHIDDIGDSGHEKIGHFLSNGDVPSVLEGRGDALARATKGSIDFLKAKNKPFFLMVEGAKIDKYAHKKNVAGIVSEGVDFDRAITEAIKFADVSKNTLVIITADHETSGFAIPQGNLKSRTIEGDFTTFDHTAAMVPIFAYGPHSHEFQGVYENSEVFDKIMNILSIYLE
ncbi:alkaline phosphatase [Flagellimonas sp.]|uniref:alkaline phosphatase n=1 Tax=Flagellimonas sp. TaxID=2058762 RepID=UPI003BAD2CD0